ATAAYEHVLAAMAPPMIAADALNGLAKLAPARAVELLTRSIALREVAQGPEHPDVGIALVNLGDRYRVLRDCARALPDYERAERLLAKLGASHPYVGHALAGRGLCLVETGKRAQAIPLLERARAIGEAADRELVNDVEGALHDKR